MKENKKLLDLLKSGDFTIVYWESGCPTVYSGKWNKEKEYKRDDYETMNKSVVDFEDYGNGYCPQIVRILVKALGGKSDSI